MDAHPRLEGEGLRETAKDEELVPLLHAIRGHGLAIHEDRNGLQLLTVELENAATLGPPLEAGDRRDERAVLGELEREVDGPRRVGGGRSPSGASG